MQTYIVHSYIIQFQLIKILCQKLSQRVISWKESEDLSIWNFSIYVVDCLVCCVLFQINVILMSVQMKSICLLFRMYFCNKEEEEEEERCCLKLYCFKMFLIVLPNSADSVMDHMKNHWNVPIVQLNLRYIMTYRIRQT